MDLADILLWTFSLTIAVASFVFSVLAALNSSRANEKLTRHLQTQWTQDVASKLYSSIKYNSIQNKNLVNFLGSTDNISYRHYAHKSAQSRLPFIPTSTISSLSNTSFNDWINFYIENKLNAESIFRKIIDIKEFSSSKMIEDDIKQKLISYHEELSEIYEDILRAYVSIA